jgi:hypothetical protein
LKGGEVPDAEMATKVEEDDDFDDVVWASHLDSVGVEEEAEVVELLRQTNELGEAPR